LGVIVYNEENNIRQNLDSILRQEIAPGIIDEIIVISSGCTDKTEEIVRELSVRDPRIRLLIQRERLGKASSINLFLKEAKGEIRILCNGDLVLDSDALRKLIEPFLDPAVGMTGMRLVPMDDSNTLAGFVVRFMWQLHHEVARIYPKLGEVVAFRNAVEKIPENTPVDEATIEAIVIEKGYRLHYISNAIARIRTPSNIKDFIIQRRRIAFGHLWLKEKYRYIPPTRRKLLLIKMLSVNTDLILKFKFFIFISMFLESIGRVLGLCDFYIGKKEHHIWMIAKSSKSRRQPPLPGAHYKSVE